jgi:hypothetical protein
MAHQSPRRGKSLKRKVATRKPRKTLLIFCEGERTEPEYLEALKRHPSVRDVAAVDLRVETGHGGSVPATLVSMAAHARRRALDDEAEIDEFWCVFDVEWPTNHPSLKAAVEQARHHNIELAVSNPCFELWLILHFQDQNAWLDNDDACRIRMSLDGARGKGIEASAYISRREVAERRAEKLERRHLEDDTHFPDNNPSSGMHRLLKAVELPEP